MAELPQSMATSASKKPTGKRPPSERKLELMADPCCDARRSRPGSGSGSPAPPAGAGQHGADEVAVLFQRTQLDTVLDVDAQPGKVCGEQARRLGLGSMKGVLVGHLIGKGDGGVPWPPVG